MNTFLSRGCVWIVSLSLINLGASAVSYAGIVSTTSVVEAGQRATNLAAVRAGLAREDVRKQLLTFGVDASQVDARLAGLSDAELQRLAGEMDSLPAGGDVLAVIGLVFIILLILEVVGVIDIFKKR